MAQPNTSAPGCFGNATTLYEVISCHILYVVQANYTEAAYDAAQPTTAQRSDWSSVVSSFLYTDGKCTAVADMIQQTSLKSVYTVFDLTDNSGKAENSYCVLVEEVNDDDKEYSKGWGIMVVPSTKKAVSRFVHLSAPFPRFALETEEQAATVFGGIGAKSLYIPGRIFLAYTQPTSCIPSPPKYFKTDPIHDNNEMFLDTQAQIINWQNANGGCASSSCAYVQFDGKVFQPVRMIRRSFQLAWVRPVNMFSIHGISNIVKDNSTGWYANHHGYPAERIVGNLATVWASQKWNVTLPLNSTCSRTSTTNIEGRLINGIDESEVCSQAATDATGAFVHIAQATEARLPDTYSTWVDVFLKSFNTNCIEGMLMNAETGLCSEK
ncbi:hypothetical protein AMATHDRAFT_5469 [Amanita thiersii Skay4041]|uniref:Uncharacterized protein n=1 Tax=Amanita thiersii Skay4041 TaxID=703135 RepID=A0A2A9NM85_9AGAR|nr:hypothetical protein AMATHDRAFT_5469 [Amanita thiersii Skay4041]